MKLGKKFLEFFGDVDEEEVIEEEEVVVKPKPQVKTHTVNESEQQPEEKEKRVMSIFGGGKKEEIGKMKVSYVSIIRPKTFEDSRLIADSIKEKKSGYIQFGIFGI